MENLGPVHTFSIHSTTLQFFDLEYSGHPNNFAFLIHGLSFGAKLFSGHSLQIQKVQQIEKLSTLDPFKALDRCLSQGNSII